ncbi:hypothetical protein GOARA_036_00190 [Gordonia araii NBRC 100433]|uniref:DUF1761 domain-containing protein n=1 Tax=Gordonia araii NBRC 100433 TaxID=1073574 RepID=G7H0B2_9ACTN|nr:DUF1761 domain-containing protein [Gordonia araii]NNG96947.1 DUF1761 domain-containing protein [Gordonia araii NBRC 100433]GAB09287.1 hypothetical protein GOARA_036_00190 [Gordonia araii NBRC 100433]
MTLSISWLAVVAGTAVGMAIAWVWYADSGLFGRVWRELTGVTQEDSARVGKRPVVVLLASIVLTAIALAIACSLAAGFFDDQSPWLALAVGFVAWLGLSATTLAQHNAFEQKPVRLTVINSAYQLALFLGIALTVGLLE